MASFVHRCRLRRLRILQSQHSVHFTWSSSAFYLVFFCIGGASWSAALMRFLRAYASPPGGNSETVRSHLPQDKTWKCVSSSSDDLGICMVCSQLLWMESYFGWQARADRVALESALASNTCMWEYEMNLKLARHFQSSDFLHASAGSIIEMFVPQQQLVAGKEDIPRKLLPSLPSFHSGGIAHWHGTLMWNLTPEPFCSWWVGVHITPVVATKA